MIADIQRQRRDGSKREGPRVVPDLPAGSPLAQTGSLLPPWFGHDFSRISVLRPKPTFNMLSTDLFRSGTPNLNLGPAPKSKESSPGWEVFNKWHTSFRFLTSFPDFDEDGGGEPMDPNAQTEALKKSILKEIMISGQPPKPLDLIDFPTLGRAVLDALAEKLLPGQAQDLFHSAKKAESRIELGLIVDLKPSLTPIFSGKGPDLTQLGGGLSLIIDIDKNWFQLTHQRSVRRREKASSLDPW